MKISKTLSVAFVALVAALMVTMGWSIGPVSAAPAGYYQDQKVVYHNDGGMPDNAAYFRRMQEKGLKPGDIKPAPLSVDTGWTECFAGQFRE